MGMFDWIHFDIKCPNCGKVVDSFQSKDGNCKMELLEYWEVDNFYAMCDCGNWIEYTLKNKYHRSYLPIEAYDMKCKTLEKL